MSTLSLVLMALLATAAPLAGGLAPIAGPPAPGPSVDAVPLQCLVIDTTQLVDECGDTMSGVLDMQAAITMGPNAIQFAGGSLAANNALAFNGVPVCLAGGSTPGCVSGVSAGFGLLGGGNGGDLNLEVDTTSVQARVSSSCAVGSSIRAVSTTGGVTCEADDTGWALGGNAGTVPGSNFLGTTDGKPLEIRASGVGLGTSSPASTLHAVKSFTSGGTVVRVDYGTPTPLIGTYGVQSLGAPMTQKGTQIGFYGESSMVAGNHPQRGAARMWGPITSGFDSTGAIIGVQGHSVPSVLDTFGGSSIVSVGVRGLGAPNQTFTLSDGGILLGGVLGEVSGPINGPTPLPARSVVAGIIGIDTTNGTAPSYAGWFDGDVLVTGHLLAHTTTHIGDVAEPAVGPGLLPGEVVVSDGFDESGKLRLARASAPLQRGVVGVVSTNPSLRLAGLPSDLPLAVSGIVPVKAVGPVAANDLLTTSAVPGHAMACPDLSACRGAILGKALESSGASGMVRMMVSLG